MKWCVLQASLGDGWPPERFEALCKGTDPFLGKILFHSVEDNGESDLHWLRKLENGKLGGAACLVTSNRKIMETSALPIIYLNKEELCRLAKVGETKVTLLENTGGANEFGKDGAKDVFEGMVAEDSMNALKTISGILSGEEEKKEVGKSSHALEHTAEDPKCPTTDQEIGCEKSFTGPDSSEEATSSGEESAVLVDMSSKSSPSGSSEGSLVAVSRSGADMADTRKQLVDTDRGSGSSEKANGEGFVDATGLSFESPSSEQVTIKPFNFGIETETSAEGQLFGSAVCHSVEISYHGSNNRYALLADDAPCDEGIEAIAKATKEQSSYQYTGQLVAGASSNTPKRPNTSEATVPSRCGQNEIPVDNMPQNIEAQKSQVPSYASVVKSSNTLKHPNTSEATLPSRCGQNEIPVDSMPQNIEAQKSQVPSYASVVKSRNPPSSQNVTPQSRELYGENSNSESKTGLLSRVWNKTKEIAGIEPKRTLKPPTDWTKYVIAVNIVYEKAASKKDKDLQDLVGDIESYLFKKDCPVPTLTLAAYICNLECQVEKKDLRKLILAHISDISILSPLGLHNAKNRFERQDIKPQHVWYDFFVSLFSIHWISSTEQGEVIVRIIWSWKEALLLSRKYNPDIWNAIRKRIPQNFLTRQRTSLIKLLGEDGTNTVSALLQDTFDDLAKFVLEHPDVDDDSALFLHAHVADHFLELFKNKIKNSVDSGHSDSQIWSLLLACIHRIRFPLGSKINDIFHGTIHAISYRTLQTFGRYDAFVDAIPGHKYARSLEATVRESIFEDLKASPGISEVSQLLASPTGELCLTSDCGLDALKQFSSQAMESSSMSFETKLLFLGDLFEKFSSSSPACLSQTISMSSFILKSIGHAKKSVNNIEQLLVASRLAENNPQLFFHKKDKTFPDRVASVLCTVDACRSLIANLEVLHELLVDEKQTEPAYLKGCLSKRIQEMFKQKCLDCDDVFRFYLSVLRSDSPASPHLIGLAVNVFCNFFSTWNPAHVSDLAALACHSLRQMYECFDLTLKSVSLSPSDSLMIMNCQEDVTTVVTTWCTDYKDEKLTKECLLVLHGEQHDESWLLLSKLASVNLPLYSEMSEKLEAFHMLERAVVDLLRGSEDSSSASLHNIFSGYSCVIEPQSAIRRLLTGYGWLLTQEESKEQVHEESDHSPAIELCHLREDVEAGTSFRDKNSRNLAICEYSLKHTSILFQSFVFESLRSSHSLETLVVAAEKAKAKISTLLGPDGNFSEISHAVNTIFAGGRTIEEEVRILTGCSELELSTEDTESFLVIATLANAAEPLNRFIQCCHQFKFEVTSDPAFAELSAFVDGTSDTTVNPTSTKDCLAFAERLCRIVEPDITSSDGLTLVAIREILRACLPVFDLLGCFSSHSEVWSFVRDMNWFGGKEGLKRFNEQYANVTNVLLGNTASYEMSVLDAVEPTVRVISAVSAFSREEMVSGLLNRLRMNDSVMSFVSSGSGAADIMQVQSNLSQIRDWFTVGVDEIASLHVTFKAVCDTGEYCLEPLHSSSRTGFTDESSQGTVPVLTLLYKTKSAKKVLQGGDLNGFIQKLGLIQHENESAVALVSDFIEQHQILSRAATNNKYMYSVGFGEAGIASFSCAVGNEHMDETRELLSEIEAKIRECDSWLSHMRAIHFVSLLYWTEELHEIHNATEQAIYNSDNEKVESAIHYLVNMVARLACGDALYEQQREVVSTLLESRGRNSTRQDTSWLADVSMFLDAVHESIMAPWKGALDGSKERSQIFLHTLTGSPDELLQLPLTVMQDVYKERLPRVFEVFDGLVDCLSDKLSVFLERARTFRSCTFIILNVESLDGKLVESILSFLSNPEIERLGIRLHLVQREGSMLHTAPWIEEKRWEPDGYQSDRSSSWKNLILDKVHVDLVSVVWSPRSGAGKTRYIQERMDECARFEKNVETAKITVHEGSSLESLTQQLTEKFSSCAGRKIVHLNLSILFDRNEVKSLRLADCINSFFFSLLVLRFSRDRGSAKSFHLGKSSWRIYVEVPNGDVESTSDSVKAWLSKHLPSVLLSGSLESPPNRFILDDPTRRVCTYLRAFDNGTIDRKFEPVLQRRILFVLDKSGSMAGSALRVATDNALRIFDTHINVGDDLGVIMFDQEVYVHIPVQSVADDDHRLRLRHALDQVRHNAGGGTYMFAALQHAFASIASTDGSIETWVVCLTDGAAQDSDEELRLCLDQSRDNVHLTIVGVNLSRDYESYMRRLCNKFGRNQSEPCKGFFVRSEANVLSMNSAFETVSRSIPVSQTFEHDGLLTDDQCHFFLDKYAPSFVDRQDMLLMTFWVQFIYRRVKVFDENVSFNYNEIHESLGSTLMKTMLAEVERMISSNQSRDWIGREHTQLIYDFTNKDAPEFRLLCTAPDQMEANARLKLEEIDLPGFTIPSNRDLQQRNTLDQYISQALNLPLKDGRLACIDDNRFILTLDFTMKLLSIHERVACQTPCVIEGETGVSKTALTRMYAILRNTIIEEEAKHTTSLHLEEIAQELVDSGHHVPLGFISQKRLEQALVEASESVIGNETDFAKALHELLLQKCHNRPSIFQGVPVEYAESGEARTTVVSSMLNWFCSNMLECTFFDVNVDSSLTERDFLESFVPIKAAAQKLRGSEAMVVIFLDEFNTSSVLGLCKEVIIDHTLAGQPLAENIVVIAACNPARQQTITVNPRERDLARDWVGGHYQVSDLPPSVKKIKWAFGSLNRDQEKEFILKRLEFMADGDCSMPSYLRVALTEFIAESQQAMRTFATRSIRDGLIREFGETSEQVDELAGSRAQSIVSLRDIQRVFSLFDFYSSYLRLSSIGDAVAAQTHRNAMLLAIATVYYLRLDSHNRTEFLKMTRSLPAEQGQKNDLQHVLDLAMDEVIAATEISPAIAVTRGLKENVFMTFVCTLSKSPLMMVGPPGASKTLSVNIVADNCNGEDSSSPFYRKHARLALYHYQCSKKSTSKELLAVFDKATQRQNRVDSSKHRCFVLMDEAGLPEEERESLKVLHYLLEGHMSAKAEVGFVGISNHVLDAAKTNRCVVLLREEPDEADMLSIARGVLFNIKGEVYSRAHQVDFGGELVPADDFARSLCQSYADMLHDDGELHWFDTFFGLRDLIHFLKALRSNSTLEGVKMTLSVQDVVRAIERNFNGVSPKAIRLIAYHFLQPLTSSNIYWSPHCLEGAFRDPVHVIQHALQPSAQVSSLTSGTRFKLIIDESGDDSILRLLNIGGILRLSKKSMFKLSRMPQDVALEELRLISGVKFAALQGKTAVLSQTESINESFYDLFNQHFQSVTGRDGSVDLYTNIAVEGVSRRSLVRPEFECVVHVNELDLPLMPAPFLNRFEKFRLTIKDVLYSGWEGLGELAVIFKRSRQSVSHLASVLSECGGIGWVNNEKTIDSLFIDLLPDSYSSSKVRETGGTWNVVSLIIEVVQSISTLRPMANDVLYVIDMAIDYLNDEDSEALRLMSREGVDKVRAWQLVETLRAPWADMSQLSRIVRNLVQMLVTRMTVRRMLQLATPESVFAARHWLPAATVADYFEQEHFSLKDLVGRLANSAKCSNQASSSIVFTRTDASIHNIPSHNITRNLTLKDAAAADRLRRLVYADLDMIVIENFSLVKSESALSASVESWAKSEAKIMLLLVDMSTSFAFEKVNYVRMLVEKLDGIGGKSFILLLHYPSSGQDGASCYPALFLAGWEYFYLDGVGNEDQLLGMKDLIEAACKHRSIGQFDNTDSITTRIAEAARLLIKRILPHIASQKLFYSGQVEDGRNSFNTRLKILNDILKTRVGGSEVAEILCRKFATIWSEHGLLNSMKQATNGLLLGTTRLSLSMSIGTALVETFDAFMYIMFVEMNQWRNLDLVLNPATDQNTLALFGLILSEIPVIPFEELVLQMTTHSVHPSLHVSPMSNVSGDLVSVQFPFFRLVSAFIDECIEAVEKVIAKEQPTGAESTFVDLGGAEMFLKTMALIQDFAAEDSPFISDNPGRTIPAIAAIAFIEEESGSHQPSLYKRYLHHFVEWRWGRDAMPLIIDCMEKEIVKYDSCRNIVAIHVAAKVKSKDIAAVASLRRYLIHSTIPAPGRENGIEQAIPIVSTEIMFGRLLNYFEESVFTDDVPTHEWSQSFLSFIHQVPALLSGKKVDDLRTACRLRALSFFSVLIDTSASSKVQGRAANAWQEREQMSAEELADALSLRNLLPHATSDDESDRLVREMGLRHFFSSAWMNVTSAFKENDTTFLVAIINDDIQDGFSSQMVVALLIRVLFHDTSTQLLTLSDVYNSQALLELGSRLSCDQLSVFSSDGKRTCIPHYIPGWLVRDGVGISPLGPTSSELQVCLSNYIQCFHCRLSTMLFTIFLQIHSSDGNENSENLLVGLLRYMHGETEVDRLKQTRLFRSRNMSNEFPVDNEIPLSGLPLGAMLLDVRLICFVAKIAYEISIDGNAAAFSGAFANEAFSLVEALMSLGHLKWQEFFIATILRVGGEGTLASSLGPNGQLARMAWSHPWIHGLPTQMNEVAQSLKEAEKALADAIADENQKSHDLRLCPHCGLPFSVLQRNCGTFVCGRDYHGNGQFGYGCGSTFQLDNAQRYRPDESVLAPYRAALAMQQSRFSEHEHAVSLWDNARDVKLPITSYEIGRNVSKRSLLPSSSFLSEIDDAEEGSDIASVVQVLLDGAQRAPHFALLPDLIELYLWMHETFPYLVTKERAFHLKVSDFVKLAILQKRFDTVSASHISSLWERVVSGVNAFLEEFDHKIAWECEEIQVEFHTLENAPMVALLSEGDHPTDGNDVLFLIINDIVGGYNRFVRQLADCFDSDIVEELHPRSVSAGCGGAVSVASAISISPSDLTLIVSSYWKPDENRYDLLGLHDALRREIGFHRSPPVIMNPSKALREPFRFRDDKLCPHDDTGEPLLVYVSGDNVCFANHQDFSLVDNVRQSLLLLEMSVGDAHVRRTLSDIFYTLGYNQLRLMLEGCRSLLASVSMACVDFDSVDTALHTGICRQDSFDSALNLLQSFGFPEMSSSQLQLLTSLDATQFVELTNFLSYQLASESYLFANLPLCMTDPLKDDDREHIDTGLDHLCEAQGPENVAKYIEEFTRDVLSFYESQIREASISNRSLKGYLAEANFCDDRDPVCALLPTRVSLHNYVSLRQHLYQRKLRFLSNNPVKMTRKEVKHNVDNSVIQLFTRPSRGRCWLWEDDDESDPVKFRYEINSDSSMSSAKKWGLWFERSGDVGQKLDETDEDLAPECPGDKNVDGDINMDEAESITSDTSDMDFDEYGVVCKEEDDVTDTKGRSASVLQKWWRKQLLEFDKGEDYMMDDGYEDMFYVFEGNVDMFDPDDGAAQRKITPSAIDEDIDMRASHPDSTVRYQPTSSNAREYVETDDTRSEEEQGHSGEIRVKESPVKQVLESRMDASSVQSSILDSVRYGSVDAERAMRLWLDDNRLPQTVGDELLKSGARDIDDIVELVVFCPEILASMKIKPLDRVKLQKAVETHQNSV